MDEIGLVRHMHEAVSVVILSSWLILDEFDLVGFVIGSFRSCNSDRFEL